MIDPLLIQLIDCSETCCPHGSSADQLLPAALRNRGSSHSYTRSLPPHQVNVSRRGQYSVSDSNARHHESVIKSRNTILRSVRHSKCITTVFRFRRGHSFYCCRPTGRLSIRRLTACSTSQCFVDANAVERKRVGPWLAKGGVLVKLVFYWWSL